jgi:cytochrome b561
LTNDAPPARWGVVAIALHWIAAAVIVGLVLIGWVMRNGGLGAAATFELFQLHKSLGFFVLPLTAARLAARLIGSAPNAPPSPCWERCLAVATQSSLYGLTVLASLLGWIAVSASPLPIPIRIFGPFVAPNLTAPNPAVYADATEAHTVAAWAIAGLVALHVCGAMKHHFFDRNETLTRILPRVRGRSR